ncbi:MAG: hypothetical protein E6Q25_00180 [Acinetobacter sp.]|jgi:uncharacterized alpha-E superfamily protein|nr:MAG: hypothetical protein E6Q25_00180 [Acinetobacter sp.]
MILLNSAAQHIFWLGRYLSRIQQICQVLPFQDDKAAVAYAHHFCLPAWNASSLNTLFLDPEQPFSIAAQFKLVQDNIQQLRAVLSPHAYAQLNQFIKVVEMKSLSICAVVHDCSEILEGEVEQVFLFYALGRVIEELDYQCRLNEPLDATLQEIEHILALLDGYCWSMKMDSLQQLATVRDMTALYHFSYELITMFEVCE